MHIRKSAAAIAASVVLCATAASAEVVLVGTGHELHLEEKFHYSLADLRHEIEVLKPDAICGEITPEAYQKPMEGYFPVEAAYLSEIAPELHAKFIPSDWRVALEWQRRAAKMVPKDIAARANEIDKLQFEDVMAFQGASLFDYMHSERFLGLSDRKFEEINGENTAADIASGAWHERNRKIVENCLDGAPDAKRVAIVFGANHIAALRHELTAQKIPFTVATRQFTPAGPGKVSDAVMARWRRNQENLKAIAEGKIALNRDGRDSISENRGKRSGELGKFIALYTK